MPRLERWGRSSYLAKDELDAAFRLWRQHGMSVSDTQRHASNSVIFEAYPVAGFNYRMTDIQAAIGLQQLQRLPRIVQSRRALAARYHRKLADMAGISLPVEPAGMQSNWQSFALRLDPSLDQLALLVPLGLKALKDQQAAMELIAQLLDQLAHKDLKDHKVLQVLLAQTRL